MKTENDVGAEITEPCPLGRLPARLREMRDSGADRDTLVDTAAGVIRRAAFDPRRDPAPLLARTFRSLGRFLGVQPALNVIRKVEVGLRWRKPSLAVFDHALHFIGGAQKYGLTVAAMLQDRFDVTLIANKPVRLQDFSAWYDLDLSRCRLEIIEIPFFEQFGTIHLDPTRVSNRTGNPFHRISRESGRYDLFLNNSMLEMVYPLAPLSMMICHFPERRPDTYFYADLYHSVIYNSRYTAEWIRNRWKFTPHRHIYPPVDMEVYTPGSEKKDIILSVARFEEGGTKKQLEMARCFQKMRTMAPGDTRSWRLVMVGGSTEDNPYLDRVRDFVERSGETGIEIFTNIAENELRSLYGDARIFWHLNGLGQNDPAKVEHFGMTIVESMQNRLVPIVFDGGGQREIVEHARSGFRVRSIADLIRHSMMLIQRPKERDGLAENAYRRSRDFAMPVFRKRVESYFAEMMDRHFYQAGISP